MKIPLMILTIGVGKRRLRRIKSNHGEFPQNLKDNPSVNNCRTFDDMLELTEGQTSKD